MDTSTKGEPRNDQSRLGSRIPTRETQSQKTPEDEADVEHTQDAEQSSDLGCPPDQHHQTYEEDTEKTKTARARKTLCTFVPPL
jgi:hypothetical protein